MLKQVAEYLKKVLSPVSQFLNWVSMAALAFAMLIVVADVLMRRLFNAPILGSHDLTTVAFSVVVFAPMAWCTLLDRHVDLTVLVSRLPKRAQRYIEVLMVLLTIAVLSLTAWQLLKQGIRLQSMNAETPVLTIPLPPFVYLATFAVVLMALVYFAKFLLALSEIVEKGQ